MKNILYSFVLLFTVTFAHAQEGYSVLIKYIPERIEILPGVFETFGKISSEGKDVGKDAYALSVNPELMDNVAKSVKQGKSQILYGPRLETLVKEKIIADYKKIRTDIENKLKEGVLETTDLQEKKKLNKKLKLEKKNSKRYMTQLKKITERYSVRAIYVYGVGDQTGQTNTHSISPVQIPAYHPISNSPYPPQDFSNEE